MSAAVEVPAAMALPARSALRSGAVAILLAVCAVATAILLAALLYRSSLRYELAYNEGWNAFWSRRAALGQAIYPPPGAMVFNNYPPLSFLLVGALSRLGIDVWIVGRAISWLSYFGCGLLIRSILRGWSCDRVAASLGAVLFYAVMATRYDNYVGTFDPQITAHLGMLCGLRLLMRPGGARGRDVALAAILIVASGFIKHNLLALPVTITIWFGVYHRRLLPPWVLAGGAGLLLGFVVCRSVFGPDFVAGLATPRRWAWIVVWAKARLWLPPVLAPFLVALLGAFGRPGDRRGVFVALYATVSFAIGLVGLAGEGVACNALFDILIAGSLGVGYAIGRAREPGAGRASLAGYAALAAVVACICPTALDAIALATRAHEWAVVQNGRAATEQRIVAEIAARPGPAVCEDLLLCYWAGKPFELDSFNFGQAVRTGHLDEAPFLALVAANRFATIELGQIEHRLSDRALAMIDRAYQPVPSLPGVFVPRDAPSNQLGANPPPHLPALAR